MGVDHWKLRKFNSSSGRGAVPNKNRFEISDDEFYRIVDYYRMFFVDNSGTLTDRYQSEYGGTNYAGYVYKFQHSARSNPDVYFTVRPVIILSKSYISS